MRLFPIYRRAIDDVTSIRPFYLHRRLICPACRFVLRLDYFLSIVHIFSRCKMSRFRHLDRLSIFIAIYWLSDYLIENSLLSDISN